MLTPVVIDYETFFDPAAGYSLRSMPSVLYVRDPQFKVHGASIKIADRPARWFTGAALPVLFSKLDWSRTIMIGHNLPFDAHITSFHYNKRAAMYIDTLAMARALIGGAIPRRDLSSVGRHYGFGEKLDGGKALAAVAGVRDLTASQEAELAGYAVQDAELTYQVFRRMAQEFPRGEYKTLDWAIRMQTEPGFVLDADVLDDAHATEVERKRQLLDSLGIDQSMINSNKQFAALLSSLGVEPPTKPSKTAKHADGTPKTTFAFSKKDMAFVDLTMHNDPVIADLVSIRLSTKTSIEETRAAMFARIARSAPEADLPAVLLPSGAMNTHRMSGADGQNLQNLGAKSRIRAGVKARPGYRIVNADLAQIELRVSLGLAGESLTLAILRNGQCVYSDFAMDLFGGQISKALAETDPEIDRKRQVGKVSVLQLGYQSGWRTFQIALWAQTGIKLSDQECQAIVDKYRGKYTRIRQLWRDLGSRIAELATTGTWSGLPRAPFLRFEPYRIVGPSGLALKYPEMHQRYNKSKGQTEFVYRNWAAEHDGNGWVPLYGGKLTENLCQFVAREVLADQTLRLIARGVVAKLQVHDALVFPVPEAQLERDIGIIREEMSRPVAWWPELPLAVDVSKPALSYADVKGRAPSAKKSGQSER